MQHKKIDAGYFHNDGMALAAARVIRNAGREHEIKLGGVDAMPQAIKAVRDGVLFEHVSFVLHRGEVFGLFGFMGAGQVQVGRCLFGARRADSGIARLEGTRLNLSNTTAATASGIAYVPEHRHESLMLRQEVYTNITLVHLKKIVGWRLQRKVEIATATRSIARLAIRPPDPLMPVGELSGGNQQKVVLAKWLIEQPRLLILTEPTRETMWPHRRK